jgi:hypothetical protein
MSQPIGFGMVAASKCTYAMWIPSRSLTLPIVLVLTLFLAIGARHELAGWKAAALLFGGGTAVLVFCLLFSWAFEGISEFERWTSHHPGHFASGLP